MNPTGAPDPAYVHARRVLLDALEALGEHHDAIVLVGAQAIYLHTGEGDLAIAPYTTDGDLVLDPTILRPEPRIVEAMQSAGFTPDPRSNVVGSWVGGTPPVQIDLMVPAALAGEGRRAARLGPQGDRTARRAVGLEAALVDRVPIVLTALDPADRRQIEVGVASPAALLVAKMHKIAERRARPASADSDKDALDVYRLLQAISTDRFVLGLRRLLATALSASVSSQAIEHLDELFGEQSSQGSQMAARAVGLFDDPDVIAASCAALARQLQTALW